MISCNAFAYSTFHFDYKKKKVSQASYLRYIKPQLKNITTEFYHIIGQQDNLSKLLIEMNQDFNKQLPQLKNYGKDCKGSDDCTRSLRRFYKKIKDINYNFLLYIESFSTKKHASFNKINKFGTSFINLQNNLISLENYLHFSLMQSPLLKEGQPDNEIAFQEKLLKLTSDIHNQFVFSILQTLPEKTKNEFETVWYFFIQEIEKFVLTNKNPKYFLRRVENLNIIWNTFSMKMTKGSIKLPSNGAKVLKIMHRRWVSILKMIL